MPPDMPSEMDIMAVNRNARLGSRCGNELKFQAGEISPGKNPGFPPCIWIAIPQSLSHESKDLNTSELKKSFFLIAARKPSGGKH